MITALEKQKASRFSKALGTAVQRRRFLLHSINKKHPSQKQAGQRIGVSQATISDLERGARPILNLPLLTALCSEVFQCSLSDLFLDAAILYEETS